MEWQTARTDRPPAPSASVALIRDHAQGLQVLMMQRHGDADVLGGAFVFPGGKVDAEDAEWIDRLDVEPALLHQRLAEVALQHEEAAALYVAAVREVFEEIGVLFAGLPPDAVRAAWAALRQGPRFGELFEGSGLRLAASALQPWSRWITPLVGGVVRKRFDTRFFIGVPPPGQEASHDEHEAVDSVWLSPREALRRYWEDGMTLAPPQIMGLAELARHGDTASVLAAARERRPPLIQPEPLQDTATRGVCYPGDPAHSVSERAWHGPTRLFWRNGRFEPEGGLQALLPG